MTNGTNIDTVKSEAPRAFTVASETANIRSLLKSVRSALDLLVDDLADISSSCPGVATADSGGDRPKYPVAVEELMAAGDEAEGILRCVEYIRESLAIK